MNLKKHPGLILVFTALVTVMCRCDATPDINRAFDQTQGGPAYCIASDFFAEDGFVTGWDTTCTVKCLDGTTRLVSFRGAKVPDIIKTEDHCGTAATLPTTTRTATAVPTATIEALSAPLLTGDVTACSLKDGFINFKLVDDDPGFNGSEVLLSINGTQVSCTVAGTNKDVLSCALPPGVTFPAQIHAAVGDASTDDFSYDGGGCATPSDPSGGGGGGGTAPTANPGGD
jgi:hypothetical protein